MWTSVVAVLWFVAVWPAAESSGMLFGSGTFTIYPLKEYECKSFAFKPAFAADSKVRVQLGLHENDAKPTYEAAVSWVELVTASGFQACIATSGPIASKRIVSLQWMAFVGHPAAGLAGVESIAMWTTGTKCEEITLIGLKFQTLPNVFATAVHTTNKNKHDATSVWVEDVTLETFKICLRELKNFDGIHEDVRVDWLALGEVPNGWRIPFENSVQFQNTETPGLGTKYSFCQEISFPEPFYSPPVMITTALHKTDKLNPKNVKPDHNAITDWIEEIKVESFTACLKDIQPYDGHHDPVTLDYMAIGYLNPCRERVCYFYAVCEARSEVSAECVCPKECPNYDVPVCASNGITYKNLCEYKKAICAVSGNFTVVHNGSCKVFVLHRGRVALKLDTTDVQCRRVVFSPQDFTPGKHVHVQLSINYFNQSGNYVHDAAVAWAEQISDMNFSVCALKAGRNDRGTPDGGLTYVDYIAYQGAPNGAAAGEESLSDWWDGTTCQEVKLPADNFVGAPHVVLSAEHTVLNQKHDAATVWAEDITKGTFKICLREMQNFDGLHKDVKVNWLAYENLPDNFLSERKQVNFPNANLPLVQDNFAFCQVLSFGKVYNGSPTVVVSASHTGGQMIPDHNSIASWVEYITPNNCRICIKEIHSPNGYDPVTVSSLIIGA